LISEVQRIGVSISIIHHGGRAVAVVDQVVKAPERHRVLAVMELEEEEEAAECRRCTRRRRQQQRREIWMRQWLTQQPRPLYGQYEQLLQELNREDANGYRNFFRVDADMFGELLGGISPRTEKRDTNFR